MFAWQQLAKPTTGSILFSFFSVHFNLLSLQVDATPMDVSHTEPLYDFAWLQSKTGTELMSVSTDGSVLWWDIRMFNDYVDKLAVRAFCPSFFVDVFVLVFGVDYVDVYVRAVL